jgi:hypothetical protein
MENEVVRTEERFVSKLNALMETKLPSGKCVGDAIMLVNIVISLMHEHMHANPDEYTDEDVNRIQLCCIRSQASVMTYENLLHYKGSVSDAIQMEDIKQTYPIEGILRAQTLFFEEFRDFISSLSPRQFEGLKTILTENPDIIVDASNPITHMFEMIPFDEMKQVSRELSDAIKTGDIPKDLDSLAKNKSRSSKSFGGADSAGYAFRA